MGLQYAYAQKAVVLTFDDGWKSQLRNAVPILDIYGYSATFFLVCNYQDKDMRLTWQEVTDLANRGYDMQAHSMNHKDLTKLSTEELKYEIGQSKECLTEHGLVNASIFATPFNAGSNNETVVNMTSQYYDIARSGNGDAMFLNCDRWILDQKDCRTYYDNGTLTFGNRYSMKGWSHNFYDKTYAHDTDKIFEKFVSVVNRQLKYNTNESLSEVPILIYHKVDNKDNLDDGTTNLDLFEKEVKYLHDNGFTILTMSDLKYDANNNRIYIPRLN